jgi:hypothetical protein
MAFFGSDMDALIFGCSKMEVLPMLTILGLQGANWVELEQIARTVGLDMMMFFAVGREWKLRGESINFMEHYLDEGMKEVLV